MDDVIDLLVLALPGVPLLLAGVGLAGRGGRFTRAYRHAASWGAAGAALAAAALSLAVWRAGPIDRAFAAGPPGLGVYVDALSAVMALLTTAVGLVVTRYSLRYLDGAPGQAKFLGWILFTLSAVLCLVCCRNLAAFVLCWAAVSLGLHRLLTFYPERPAARRAAGKKFIISRLGDLCLVGGLALTYHAFGTLDLPELFRLAAGAGASGAEVSAAAALFVLGAMTKSAQFPFHTWLPETMETPTPVSALMHAGIINAGGYLVVRLSPLISQSPLALDVLLVNGAVTAALGSVVMLTQTDVKRALAYSTVSQMGFMMMQCGLGAFSAAVLHIVAHGLYKAHAFLAAGAVTASPPARPVLPAGRAAVAGCAALSLAAGVVGLAQLLAGVDVLGKPGGLVISTFLTAGVAVIAFRALTAPGLAAAPRAVIACLGLPLVAAYLSAWKLVDAALAPFLSLSRPLTQPSGFDHAFSLAVAGLTVAALLVGWAGHGLARGAVGRRVYVHVLNGFYIADLLRAPLARRRAARALSGQGVG